MTGKGEFSTTPSWNYQRYLYGAWQNEVVPLQSNVRGGVSDEVKCEDLVKVTIGDDPEKFFQVGSQLPQQEREELVEFLKRNIDVFAWNAYEALGVDPDFICHHLNVNPLTAPKK